jgi:phosphoribosylaminoimidazole carboxylase PurE protein
MASQVLILMGSDSDLPTLQPALDMLKKFGISCTITVSSAHRSPERTKKLVSEAERGGTKVIICAAGGAAHLAGVVAAETILPVIGVPVNATPLNGMDALLSTVMMPPGIPVATVAVGPWGATNAAIYAAEIIALGDAAMAEKLRAYKREMADGVEKKAAKLKESLGA